MKTDARGLGHTISKLIDILWVKLRLNMRVFRGDYKF